MTSPSSSSPTTTRFFQAYSAGPPKRTYTRRGRSSMLANDDEIVLSPVTGSTRRGAAGRIPTPTGERSTSPSPSPRKRQDSSSDSVDSPSSRSRPLPRTRRASKAKEDPSRRKEISPEPASESTKRKRKRGLGHNSAEQSSSPRPTRASSRVTSASQVKDYARTRTPSPPRHDATDGIQKNPIPQTPPRSVRPPKLPRTPSSASPGDFAQMFAAISPGSHTSPYGTPRTKKLLGKSQSSGAVLDTPSKLRHRLGQIQGHTGPSTPSRSVSKSASMPLTPSKSSPQRVDSAIDPSAILLKTAVPEGQGSGGRAKRVYGRSRTVVADHAVPEEGSATLEEQLARESYVDLQKRYEINPADAAVGPNDYPDLILARAPQPVNDMRSRGENRRYMDETGYLLDGMMDPSASKSYKRSSSVDLLESIIQPDWLAKMKVCGLTERVWSALADARGSGDELMDTVCLLALYIIVRSGDGIEAIVRCDADYLIKLCFSYICAIGGHSNTGQPTSKSSILLERVNRITHTVMAQSPVSAPTPTRSIVTAYLASVTMASLCVPDTFPDAITAFQSQHALARMSEVVASAGQGLGRRFALYEGGLPLFPHESEYECITLENHLAITDSLFVNTIGERGDLLQGLEELARGAVLLVIGTTNVALSQQDKNISESASRSLSHALKVFANIVNVVPALVSHLRSTHGANLAIARVVLHRHRLAGPPAVSSTEARKDDEAPLITGPDELLSLALAIWTSGCIEDSEFTKQLAALRCSTQCLGHRPCLRTCNCPDNKLIAITIADLYGQYTSADSTPDMEIVSAYAALLLTKVIIVDANCKDAVVARLSGENAKQKLATLASSLLELEEYRSLLDRRIKTVLDVQDEEWQDDQGVVRQAIADLTSLQNSYA